MPLSSNLSEVIIDDQMVAVSDDALELTTLSAAEWTPESGAALALEVDDEPDASHAQASLITINFGAFNDGRGLSLAVLLRSRFGFTGELRAIGDVHPDLLHYMQRCGFSSYVLPTHRSLPDDNQQQVLNPYSEYYQGSVVNPQPAFRRLARGH